MSAATSTDRARPGRGRHRPDARDASARRCEAQAEKNAEERVLDALVGASCVAGDARCFRKRLRANELERQGDRDPGGRHGPAVPDLRHPRRRALGMA